MHNTIIMILMLIGINTLEYKVLQVLYYILAI